MQARAMLSFLGHLLLGLTAVLSSAPLGAEPVIRLATGQSLMPYTSEASQNGLELDIVREALARAGYRLEVSFYPMARVAWALQHGQADAATPMAETAEVPGICYSDSHVRYQNVAVSLASRGFSLQSVADLADKKVIAFQYASKYLGSAFGNIADNNPRYQELAHQDRQVKALFAGDADVIVLDLNIYRYQLQQLQPTLRQHPVTIHSLFPPNDYKVGFRDTAVCAAFNQGLAALRADGSYQAILDRYIRPD